MRFKSFLTVLLTAAMVLPSPGVAQQAGGAPAAPAIGDLKIVVLEGEGALNSVRSRSAIQPVVEVRDDKDKPVAGAEVVFTLPAAGPGGVFNGWMRSQTAKTNAQGQAGASGMTPNEDLGRFNIKVLASAGGKTASVIIAQTNVAAAVKGKAVSNRGRTWKILAALAAAGAIGGAVAATRNGGSSAPSAVPVTITPGAVTVGGPR